jgi:hypothetical protein
VHDPERHKSGGSLIPRRVKRNPTRTARNYHRAALIRERQIPDRKLEIIFELGRDHCLNRETRMGRANRIREMGVEVALVDKDTRTGRYRPSHVSDGIRVALK